MKYRIITTQQRKAVLIGLLSILLIQFLTLNLFSEKLKAETIIEDLSLLIYTNQFDSLAFETNLNETSENLFSILTSRFKDTFKYIEFYDSNEWGQYRVDSNYLAIRITDISSNKSIFNSEVNAGTLYYGESWKNKYIWVLFKWFKLEQKNTGVS